MVPNKPKFILFAFLLTLFFVVASSCTKKTCNGCYEDTPWSGKDNSSEDCYPTKESCEKVLGDKMCEKCD